ncbi:MAG TPA: addiction module antitoxin RelB [Fibrobacteres bacterium]|jgi:putative addiction module component (TIGR02574 family)|nr:addiction module antitoxin RelB [Fibrobacterota bacterium]
MSKTLEKVMSDALELPPALRAFMAEKLIESLDSSEVSALSSKWKTEIRRRSMEIDQGIAKTHSADAVFKRAFASLS